jgi:phosphoribosylanthranilate isomerase
LLNRLGAGLRVKICGITNVVDGLAAAEAGADAIGLNFVGGPRRIEPAVARDILRALPAMVMPVALVRVGPAGLSPELLELFAAYRVSHLQVYGWDQADETSVPQGATDGGLAGLIAAGFRVMPALTVKDMAFAERLAAWGAAPAERQPCAVVLDAYDPAREGGTGRRFEWEWVVRAREGGRVAWPPIFLAGGLHPGNVGRAIGVVRPYGVDVSSGVEIDGVPGRKDRAKMMAFVRNARAAANAF